MCYYMIKAIAVKIQVLLTIYEPKNIQFQTDCLIVFTNISA
jgi:hypothetical protein